MQADFTVQVGTLKFEENRVVRLRKGREVFSLSREGVKDVRVDNESVSEAPLRDMVWGVGLLTGGIAVLLAGGAEVRVMALLGGCALVVIGVVMLRHAIARTTVVTINDRGTRLRVDVGEELDSADRTQLRKDLKRLGWTARKPISGPGQSTSCG